MKTVLTCWAAVACGVSLAFVLHRMPWATPAELQAVALELWDAWLNFWWPEEMF